MNQTVSATDARKGIDPAVIALVRKDLEINKASNPWRNELELLESALEAYADAAMLALAMNKAKQYAIMSDARRYIHRTLDPLYPF